MYFLCLSLLIQIECWVDAFNKYLMCNKKLKNIFKISKKEKSNVTSPKNSYTTFSVDLTAEKRNRSDH